MANKNLLSQVRGVGSRLVKAAFDPDQWRAPYAAPGYLNDRFGSSVVGYGNTRLGDYLTIYRNQPAVRQVIEFKAENAAQVPIRVYQRQEQGRRHLADHWLQRLFDDPNTEQTQFEFLTEYFTDLELFDCVFYEVMQSEGQVAVERLFPDAVELMGGSPLAPKTFRVHQADGTYRDLPRGRVLWQHGYGSRRGTPPMETLRQVLAEDDAFSRHRENMYRNGMRNAGVVERPLDAPPWTEPTRNRFLDQLENRYTGDANAGRPLLLEEGMTWKSDQINLRNDEAVNSKTFTLREVTIFFHVSPPMLGITDAPYASITEYNRQLYQNALAPMLVGATQRWEKDFLLPEERRRGVYVEFALEAKLRGSFVEQANIASIALGGKPWMTVEEWRARMDLPALSEEQLAQLLGSQPEPEPGPDDTGAGEVDQPAPSEDVPKSEQKRRDQAVKASERGLVRRREKYAEDLEKVLVKTLERFVAAKSAGDARVKRFEQELAQDLRSEFQRIVVAEGTRKATQLGEEFDPGLVRKYLDEGAKRVGANVAGKAEEAVERHTREDGTVDDEALGVAFAAVSARVAVGQASHLVSFAREEAAKQGGAAKKTWVTTSDNSRHADVDGETVGIDEEFSNGLRYPGDPAGDVDDTAGCQCLLDVGGE